MKLEKIIGWLVISLATVGAFILLAVLCYGLIFNYGGGVTDLRGIIVPIFGVVILSLFVSVAVTGLELIYPGRYLKNSYGIGIYLILFGSVFLLIGFLCMQYHHDIVEALIMSLPSVFLIPSGYWLVSKRRGALYAALFCIGFATTFVGSSIGRELSGTWAASGILVSVLGGIIVVTTLALLLRERRLQY